MLTSRRLLYAIFIRHLEFLHLVGSIFFKHNLNLTLRVGLFAYALHILYTRFASKLHMEKYRAAKVVEIEKEITLR